LKTLVVNTGSKKYPINIGDNIFKTLPKLINENKLPKRVFVVIDKNVERIYRRSIRKVINGFSSKRFYLALSASEKIKSLKAANEIYCKLLKEKFGKDTLLIAIGGGTIGDLAGFTASTYMRGIPIIHIPTTILSAVDSSIGGKTGVNFHKTKNLVGTFYHPELVLIDTSFLNSLPKEEMISGIGEVIKYSYLTNKKFYSDLLSNLERLLMKELKYLEKIIYECVSIKSAVVSKDEKEVTGLRKILNFGHTFAHAFESTSSYKISHGKAVIAGIVGALNLSFEQKLINEVQLNYMLKLPMKFKFSTDIKRLASEAIFNKMTIDKKNKDDKINFVLLRDFGEILIDVSVDRKSVIKSLEITEQNWFKRATAGL
jgi:3-dehydroquinate synthase